MKCVFRADIIRLMYTPPENPADEPEHLTRYLAEPIAATWRAFDRGRAAADEFFAAQDHREFDPHMWAHIARYEAVLSLKGEPEPKDWELKLSHHSGIEIRKDGFRIKVGKAAGDGPQSPGRNRARTNFVQQLGLLQTLFTVDRANLILYWRILKGELDLGLCKPKGLWNFRSQPKLEWRQPVRFDPLAGLRFPTADDTEEMFGFDRDAFGDEEASE